MDADLSPARALKYHVTNVVARVSYPKAAHTSGDNDNGLAKYVSEWKVANRLRGSQKIHLARRPAHAFGRGSDRLA